ncbi:MAG: MBL fold metallo-hydrolase [Lachnospiraceae bacterium]|nr:MBL fold metallo-hydrolase [Lachnospiraceae bacterium]
MIIHELHYAATNTYLIEGERGRLLFDTGWAGTFEAFCRAMGELRIPVQSIDTILISHYHPDHMGIAQEIADRGAVIAAAEVQREYIHAADGVFAKDAKVHFQPIDDAKIRWITPGESREFLAELGIDGEIIVTPGHSEDSISLALDDGSLFVGDLNPLYELELHGGTTIAESWSKLLARKPRTVYYGHAKTAVLGNEGPNHGNKDNGNVTARATVHQQSSSTDRYILVAAIMKGIDKGWDIAKIRKKTGADEGFIEDVMRMYLTHQNVGVQGILDRIEIKNK